MNEHASTKSRSLRLPLLMLLSSALFLAASLCVSARPVHRTLGLEEAADDFGGQYTFSGECKFRSCTVQNVGDEECPAQNQLQCEGSDWCIPSPACDRTPDTPFDKTCVSRFGYQCTSSTGFGDYECGQFFEGDCEWQEPEFEPGKCACINPMLTEEDCNDVTIVFDCSSGPI